MFKVVGVKTGRVYGTAKTRAEAQKVRRRVSREQFVTNSYFKIVGPVCQFCGKACPCGKVRHA